MHKEFLLPPIELSPHSAFDIIKGRDPRSPD